LTPNEDIPVLLISGEVNLQPPFPIPANLPTENNAPEPLATQDDLAALFGAFGKKPENDKKKKK
jgi:hypothetical protein